MRGPSSGFTVFNFSCIVLLIYCHQIDNNYDFKILFKELSKSGTLGKSLEQENSLSDADNIIKVGEFIFYYFFPSDL